MASTFKLLAIASMAWFPYLLKLTNSFPSFSLPHTPRYVDSTSSHLPDKKLAWGIILDMIQRWIPEAPMQTVPYSNRVHQVILPLGIETLLGKFQFWKDLRMYEDRNDILPPTHPTVVRVQSIARKIFDVLDSELGINGATSTMKEGEVSQPRLRQSTAHLEGIEWEVVVAREKSINASYYSGGKILVFTDRSGKFGTDADIAWAIAHEVGHAVARHAADRFNDLLIAVMVEVRMKASMIGTPRLHCLLKFPIWKFIVNWFSRRREKEADQIAMLLCASAGYDPNKVLNFFGKHKDSPSQNIFSTHPSGKTRVKSLSQPKIMKQALYRYQLVRPGPWACEQTQGIGLTQEERKTLTGSLLPALFQQEKKSTSILKLQRRCLKISSIRRKSLFPKSMLPQKPH